MVEQRRVPEAIVALAGMERPDYVDLFSVSTSGADDASVEQWSRTAVEDVAGAGGQLVWRGVLGLRLTSGPRAERVGGWKVAARGDDWLRLEASSWFMAAHLVVRVRDAQLSVATFIRYRHPIAPFIWVPASAFHRRSMPGLLRGAVRRRAALTGRASRETVGEVASAQGDG